MKEAMSAPLTTTQDAIKEFQHASKLKASVNFKLAVDKWIKFGKKRLSDKLRISQSEYLNN